MWFHSTAQVVFATWRAANSRPLHAHWWVVPFNPTGCNRYVVMVVLRAANQNQLIAGGNHTLITSMNHRRYIAWYRSTARVISETLHGGAPRSESKSTDCRGQSHLDSIDESSPLHCVVPFTHTGCIRYIAKPLEVLRLRGAFYYRGMRIVVSGFVWAAVFSQLSTSGFSSS